LDNRHKGKHLFRAEVRPWSLSWYSFKELKNQRLFHIRVLAAIPYIFSAWIIPGFIAG